MSIISVIVPIYRVERYMDKCINSILNQSYTDIEVILVDDGSPDECGKKCDEWARKDNRICVIHKENGGLSDARNVGMAAANGKYISFVDSDDYIHKDMLKVLYEGISKSGADISTCGVYNVYGTKVTVQVEGVRQQVCDGTEAYAKIMEGKDIPAAVWNKLYTKKILEGLYFPSGKIYEDAFFTAELMPRVSKVWMTTQPLYYYVHRKSSITTETFNSKGMDVIEAYQKNREVVKEYFPNLEMLAEFRELWSYFIVLDRILLIDTYRKVPEYKPVITYLRKNWRRIIRNPYFQKSRRIAAICLRLNVFLYRQLVLIREKKEALYD